MAVRERLGAAAIKDEANAPPPQKNTGLLNVFSIRKRIPPLAVDVNTRGGGASFPWLKPGAFALALGNVTSRRECEPISDGLYLLTSSSSRRPRPPSAPREAAHLARLQAAQAALKLAEALLAVDSPEHAQAAARQAEASEQTIAAWKRSGRGWFESRHTIKGYEPVQSRNERTGEDEWFWLPISFGPYRYFRWREPDPETSRLKTQTWYLGKQEQTDQGDPATPQTPGDERPADQPRTRAKAHLPRRPPRRTGEAPRGVRPAKLTPKANGRGGGAAGGRTCPADGTRAGSPAQGMRDSCEHYSLFAHNRPTHLLSRLLVKSTGKSQKETAEVVNATLDAIRDALKAGDEVRLVGFGSFVVKPSAARADGMQVLASLCCYFGFSLVHY